MANKLKVSWRGSVYEVPVCYDAARCAVISDRWPDGVIDLLKMLEATHPHESMRQREWLAAATLRVAGELAPALAGASALMRPALSLLSPLATYEALASRKAVPLPSE